MSKYVRKTRDRWDVMTNCGYGWECECSEYSRTEAWQTAKEYRKTLMPGYGLNYTGKN